MSDKLIKGHMLLLCTNVECWVREHDMSGCGREVSVIVMLLFPVSVTYCIVHC